MEGRERPEVSVRVEREGGEEKEGEMRFDLTAVDEGREG